MGANFSESLRTHVKYHGPLLGYDVGLHKLKMSIFFSLFCRKRINKRSTMLFKMWK